MAIRDALRDELSQALRRRDTAVVNVLRTALSTLANAEAAPGVEMRTSTTGSKHVAGAVDGLGAAEVPRVQLSEERQRALVGEELAQIARHAERLTSLCRRDEADAALRASRTLSRILDAPDPA